MDGKKEYMAENGLSEKAREEVWRDINKKKGKLSKGLHKMANKVGWTDKTEMSEALIREIASVDAYRAKATELYDAMAGFMKPFKDRKLMNTEDSPTMNLRYAIMNFTNRLKAEEPRLDLFIAMLDEIEKRDREFFDKVITESDGMCKYVSNDAEKIARAKAAIERACLGMDDTRHELEHAKTLTDVEKKGYAYQQYIQIFDDNALLLHTAFIELPFLSRKHQYDLMNFLQIYERRMNDNYKTVREKSAEIKNLKA